MAKSIAQQVEMLRQAAAPRLITGGETIVLLIGIAGMAAGFGFDFVAFAIFLMIVVATIAIERHEQAPRARNALRALDAGKQVAVPSESRSRLPMTGNITMRA